MKKMRQVHLWIGLITSLIILVEAVTGLLLSEPWLMGAAPPDQVRREIVSNVNPAGSLGGQVAPRPDFPAEIHGQSPQTGRRPSGVMGVVRGLHEGRIGGVDLRWVVDVTAVGMVLLTVTGIVLSVRLLRAQNRKSSEEMDLEI